jgi:hypothetical protein
MSIATTALFAYGYDLGGPEEGWRVEEAGEYGEWQPGWLNVDTENIIESAETELLIAAGLTENYDPGFGFHQRVIEVQMSVGVTFVQYRSVETPQYILAAHHITTYQADPLAIDLTELEERRLGEGWDAKLQNALRVLGATPKQRHPAWLLAADRT